VLGPQLEKNGLGNVYFALADATSLPFAANSFDASCVSFALHDMPPAIRKSLEGNGQGDQVKRDDRGRGLRVAEEQSWQVPGLSLV
jgi:SAM-dependent methyltransferase